MRNNPILLASLTFLFAVSTYSQSASWAGTYYYLFRRDSTSPCPYFLGDNPHCPNDDGEAFTITQTGQRIVLNSITFPNKVFIVVNNTLAISPDIKLVRDGDKVTIKSDRTTLPIYRNLPAVWAGKYKSSTCTSKVVCCPIGDIKVKEGDMNMFSMVGTTNGACKRGYFSLVLEPTVPYGYNLASFEARLWNSTDKTIYTLKKTSKGISIKQGNILSYEILQ